MAWPPGGSACVATENLEPSHFPFQEQLFSTLAGVISDGGSGFGLTTTGVNNLSLNAVNTYTGTTNVLGGAVLLPSAASIAGNATVAPGATLQLNAANQVNGGAGTVAIASNNLSLGVLSVGTATFALPTITGNSSGLLSLNTAYSTALDLST